MKFDFKVDWQGKDARTVMFDIEGADEEDDIPKLIRKHCSFYETPLLRYLAQRGPCGGVYVDAGANIGNHAVFFGAFLADFLVAIEPEPRLAAALRRNLAANGITQAAVVECAIGATQGRGRLWLPDQHQHNAGATRVVPVNPDANSGDGHLVEISTLDRVIEGMSSRLGQLPITLIKLDVEGMELAALMGATRVLRSFRPQLVVELKSSEEFAAVTTFLADHGYCAVGRFEAPMLTYHFISPTQHQLRVIPCDLGR